MRVALEIARETEGSTFVQTVRLSAGDAGNRVEVANALDWMTKEAHLKAVFPLTASNPNATYNWDIGTIERPTNHERQFEVASHQWFDLTDKAGAFGVTVLSDSKIASDKPADNILRLTLVRTPGIARRLRGPGRRRTSATTSSCTASPATPATGGRGRPTGRRSGSTRRCSRSSRRSTPGRWARRSRLLAVSNSRVRVLAVKKAEQSDEVIVRAVELDGRPAKGVRFTFASPLAGAREVNGAEDAVGDASVVKGELVADFTPYQVRSFALKLGAAPATVARPRRAGGEAGLRPAGRQHATDRCPADDSTRAGEACRPRCCRRICPSPGSRSRSVRRTASTRWSRAARRSRSRPARSRASTCWRPPTTATSGRRSDWARRRST